MLPSDLYVSGWIGTGPIGVILSTMQSGFKTGKLVVNHLTDGTIDLSEEKLGKRNILEILNEKSE